MSLREILLELVKAFNDGLGKIVGSCEDASNDEPEVTVRRILAGIEQALCSLTRLNVDQTLEEDLMVRTILEFVQKGAKARFEFIPTGDRNLEQHIPGILSY